MTGRKAAAKAAEDTETVKPAANYQLAHDGVVVGPGESITVPREVAAQWRLQGLVD